MVQETLWGALWVPSQETLWSCCSQPRFEDLSADIAEDEEKELKEVV